MESLHEEIYADKISLAVLHFKARHYEQSATILSELISTFSRNYSNSQLVKLRRFYDLSDQPAVGKLAHPKLASVLDQRAACYEKLGRVDDALADARMLIATEPANCKGYLRLGKLLVAQGHRHDAYKNYLKGLQLIEKAQLRGLVEVSPKLLAQLQSQCRSLDSSLKKESMRSRSSTTDASLTSSSSRMRASGAEEPVPLSRQSSRGLQASLDMMLPLEASRVNAPRKRMRRSTDLFEWLPPELIEQIFVHVPTRTLLNCHLVCKQWYHDLVLLPNVYRNRFRLKHRVTAKEYTHGLKLMKKIAGASSNKSLHFIELRSAFNASHLGKILDSIITDRGLRLNRLHLSDRHLSLDYLVKKMDEWKWRFFCAPHLKHLRLGVNSSIYLDMVLLHMFPNLESLDIVTIDGLPRGHRPLSSLSDLGKHILHESNCIHEHANLSRLAMENHPLLTRDHQSTRPGLTTFDPRPLFVTVRFPGLSELKITSYDFTGHISNFSHWLKEMPALAELYLENNEEIPLEKFLNVLSSSQSQFTLRKLTFRERNRNGAYNIDEINGEQLSSLHALESLDIYGSSITGPGLMRLLQICNTEGKLTSLNIGNSGNIQFKNDKFITGTAVVSFSQLFVALPALSELYMPELDIDNLSLKLFHADLRNTIGIENSHLRKLDFSLCHQIDGVGLMSLFDAVSQPTAAPGLALEMLSLDGLQLRKETIDLLVKRGYTKTVKNDQLRTKWRQYGINSCIRDPGQVYI